MGKKNIDLENVPFSKPTRTDFLFQVDFKIGANGSPETSIHKWGCCFMSHITIVQIMHSHPLKYNEILEIYDKCMEAGWLGTGCWVKQPAQIMSYVENYITNGRPKYKYSNVMCLGISQKDRTFNSGYFSADRLPSKSNIYFCVMDFDTKSGPEYGGHHFVLFSGTGNLLYDPNKKQIASGFVGVAKISYWKVEPVAA